MTPKPLNASPLRILSHTFSRIRVDAAEAEEAPGGISLNTRRSVLAHCEDERKFLLTLAIQFGSEEREELAPYSGELIIEGEFEVAPNFPLEKAGALVDVTGASILYGACREMLANLTARSTFGMISLPSVSFLEPTPPKKKAAKKKAAAKKSPRTRSKK